MIRVHHLDHSRSHRVLWLLEELGVPYGIVPYARDPATRFAPPELRAIHPLGKSPVVEEEGQPLLAESGAIMEGLLERHDPGRTLSPATGTPEHARYRYWMHFAEGSFMLPLVAKLYLLRVGEPAAQVLQRIDGALADILDHADAELADRPFFAGDAFTAADIQMGFPVEAAVQRAGLTPRHTHLWGWLERTRARPAWRRATARGGPPLPG